MTLAISNRYKLYQPVVPTTDFIVSFPLYDASDLAVFVDGVAETAFTVLATFINGRSDDASIVLVSAATDVDVEIYGARSPRRENDYLPSSPNLTSNLQRDVEEVTVVQQEQKRDFVGALKVSTQESVAPLGGDAASRGGRVVSFSDDGLSLVSGPTYGEISSAQEYADDLSGKLHRFKDRVIAETATIGAFEMTIAVNAFDASVNDNWGRATYRRSTLTEVAAYPALAWFRSADGAYWLLDEDRPTIVMFGGQPHATMAEMLHTVAIDSTAQIDAARSYALLRRVGLYVFGYFKYNGTFQLAAGEALIGAGSHMCGFQIWNDNTQTGIQYMTDDIMITGIEVMAYLTEAKLAGGASGMIGCSLVGGNFMDGTVPQPKNFYLDDLYLTRKPNETGHTSYNGIAIQISGGTKDGYIGHVMVGVRHSVALMCHWNGDNSALGGTITQSVHPRNNTLEKLIVSGDVEAVLTLSGAANLNIGSVIADKARSLLTVLPGDDLDTFNIGQPNVGASLRIDELVCDNITTTGLSGTNNDALSVTSLGTSKFQTAEGLPLKGQMRIDVSIGALTMHTDDAAMVYGIDLFEFFGSFHVEHARITGFAEAYRARYSRGDIRVNFDFTDGRCEVLDSDTVLTGSFDRGDPSGTIKDTADVTASRNVYVNSSYWSLAANNVTRGDTSITVPAGIATDIFRGCKIEITGTTGTGVETLAFTVDNFTESALTIVDLGLGMPHSMTGVTLNYIGDSDVIVDATSMKGSRTGVFIDAGKAKVRGGLYAGRFNTYVKGANAALEYEVSTGVSGLARTATETFSVYDMFAENGCTVILSGDLGGAKVSGAGIYYSIGAYGATSPSIHIRNARVVDATKVVAVNETADFSIVGAYADDGTEFTILDTVGLSRTGSDVNGYFVRYLDGTMKCWQPSQDIAVTEPYIWTFPGGGFTDINVALSVTPTSSTAARMGGGRATSATAASITVHTHDGTHADNTSVSMIAVGMWK